MNQELIEKVKEVQRTTDINFSPYYDFIPNLINERGYKKIIEIGIFAGGHSKAILDKTNVEILIGIDPYLEYKPDQINMGTIVTQDEYNIMMELAVKRLDRQRFKFMRCDSNDGFMMLHDPLGNTKYDLVFIDGGHTKGQLFMDIHNFGDLLIKTGGVVAGHDINHPTFPDLTQVIYDYANSHNAEVVLGPLHSWYINKTW